MDELDGRALREDALAGGEQAREAFLRLWETYYRRLMYFALSFQGLPRSEYDDLVSDVLIRGFTSLKSYNPSRPLSPWLYKIAANYFRDALKRAGKISPVIVGAGDGRHPSYDPPDAADHTKLLEERDMAERCREVIGTLEPPDRRIAFLRFFEGMNASEISRVMKIPAGTVRWKIHEIRNRISILTGEKPW
ncbi:RNA polymerase sigma factor [Breznakiella homolactica]|uniref:Sigma-70 family RNA polymerase sigma factor n=1 Tax=Breznakiella homolactica TaxID=2798577 RepID=A0A7T7XNQ0_9SPIR|nr:sigma-70 family RNA polymerase sigma factor [Breznakiella homolactica]QQO09598.1 sigma-70 family RNA polymerase sigma factor [Breznakiella homolactica]